MAEEKKSTVKEILRGGMQGFLSSFGMSGHTVGVSHDTHLARETSPYSESKIADYEKPVKIDTPQKILIDENNISGADIVKMNNFAYEGLKKHAEAITRVDKKVIGVGKDFTALSGQVLQLAQGLKWTQEQLSKKNAEVPEPKEEEPTRVDTGGGYWLPSPWDIIKALSVPAVLTWLNSKMTDIAQNAMRDKEGKLPSETPGLDTKTKSQYQKLEQGRLPPGAAGGFFNSPGIFPPTDEEWDNAQKWVDEKNKNPFSFKRFWEQKKKKNWGTAEQRRQERLYNKPSSFNDRFGDWPETRSVSKSGMDEMIPFHKDAWKNTGSRLMKLFTNPGGTSAEPITQPEADEKTTEKFEMIRSDILFESKVSDIEFKSAMNFKVKAGSDIIISGRTITLDAPSITFTSKPKFGSDQAPESNSGGFFNNLLDKMRGGPGGAGFFNSMADKLIGGRGGGKYSGGGGPSVGSIGALEGTVHGHKVNAYGGLTGQKLYEPMTAASLGGGLGGTSAMFGPNMHEGIDLMNTVGTQNFSPMPGRIKTIHANGNDGSMVIEHFGPDGKPNGIYSRFLHQSGYNVKEGDVVQGGQPVSLSGYRNAAHTHFEMWKGSPSGANSELINTRALYGWNKDNLPQGGREVTGRGSDGVSTPAAAAALGEIVQKQIPIGKPTLQVDKNSMAAGFIKDGKLTGMALSMASGKIQGGFGDNWSKIPSADQKAIVGGDLNKAAEYSHLMTEDAKKQMNDNGISFKQEYGPAPSSSFPSSPISSDGKMPSWVTPNKRGEMPEGVGGSLTTNRARFAKELESNPALREKVLAISLGEQGSNSTGNLSVLESAMNRAAMMGTSLEKEMRLTSENGYYTGYKPEALNNPEQRAMAETNLAKALGGSNASRFATENASGSFAQGRMSSGMFSYTSDSGGEYFMKPSGSGARGLKQYDTWLSSVQTPDKPTAAQMLGGDLTGSRMLGIDPSMMYKTQQNLSPQEQFNLRFPKDDEFAPTDTSLWGRAKSAAKSFSADTYRVDKPVDSNLPEGWKDPKPINDKDMWDKVPTSGPVVGEKVTDEVPFTGETDSKGRRDVGSVGGNIRRHSTNNNPEQRGATPNDAGAGERRDPDHIGLCSVTS